MNKLMTTGTLGLASLVTTGLVAWQAPVAVASHGSGDSGRDGSQHGKAFKREDDTQVLVTTVDDDDDDDTGQTRTRSNTNTGANRGTNTGTRTRGRNTDHSRARAVRDLTGDGPGRGNVDHSRRHTNDRSRHNTRG